MGTSSFIPDPSPTPRSSFVPDPPPQEVKGDPFKAGVHSQILGTSPGFAYQNQNEIDTQMRSRFGNYDDGKLDPTILNDIKVGYESSIYGLYKKGQLPEQVRDPGLVDRFVTGLTSMVEDLPFYVAGGIAGGAAGTPVAGPAGAAIGGAAGGFALPAGVREALVQGIKNGDVKDFSDLMHRAASVTWEAAKGAAVGTVTELAGGIPVAGAISKVAGGSMVAKGLYQATALTTASSVLEGQVPNLKDFTSNAALLIPLNLITHGTPLRSEDAKTALMDVYKEDGTTPQDSHIKVKAQPPVNPPPAPGLRPAIKIGDTPLEGEVGQNHSQLAESVGSKPVTMNQLEADPKLSDKVLEKPEIHEQSVIDKAWELKKEDMETEDISGPTKRNQALGIDEPVEIPLTMKDGTPFTLKRDFAGKYKAISEDGKEIGSFSYTRLPSGEWKVTGADVKPEFQRKGIATSAYDALEKVTGNPFSDTGSQSEMGQAFWESRSARGPRPPSTIEQLYNRGEMKSGRGFTTPDGKFLTREQARAWVKENEPEVHKMWTDEAGGKDAEFHSGDYFAAKTRAESANLMRGSTQLHSASQELTRFMAENREGMKDNEQIRTLFVGPRNMFTAEAAQLVGRLKKLVPESVDQEAISFMRDYRDDPSKLAAKIEEIRAGDNEELKKFIPSMERALNPTPQMMQADAQMTDYFRKALDRSSQLQIMSSTIDPARYSPRMFVKAVDEASRGGKRPILTEKTPHAIQREYLNLLDPLTSGGVKARTFNALDELQIYGDRHATSVATKMFTNNLRESGLGVEGSKDDHPKDWVELHGSNGLYVPSYLADAMKPVLDTSVDPKMQKFLHVQGVVKGIELGLSFFHIKAMGITAMNNMELRGYIDAMHSDNSSPEFEANEQIGALHGLETTKTGPQYEAYKGFQPSSAPEKGFARLRNIPLVKQADAFAKSITETTFNVIQRKFKVVDFTAKRMGWEAKHPDATPEEYSKAMRGYAKEVNASYGGLNWEVMGVSKQMQSISRLFLLAPDWTFSNVLNAKYALGSGAAGQASRAFWVKSAVTGFAMTAAASIAIGGKYDPSDLKHMDQVYLGKDKNGKEMYANWFFAGAPKDAMTLIKKSASDTPLAGTAAFIVNKAAPLVGTVGHLAMNVDYGSKPIYKKTDSFVKKLEEQSGYTASRLAPISGVSAIQDVKNALEDPTHEWSYKDLLQLAADSIGAQTTHENPPKGDQPTEKPRGQTKRSKGFHIPGVKR